MRTSNEPKFIMSRARRKRKRPLYLRPVTAVDAPARYSLLSPPG